MEVYGIINYLKSFKKLFWALELMVLGAIPSVLLMGPSSAGGWAWVSCIQNGH